MNFNYRDFFIHNDDLHTIKEQLSILDGMVPRQDGLTSNAKAVWNEYQTESNEQKIADKLKINVETVKKIIQICLMNIIDNKSVNTINKELGNKLSTNTIRVVLKNALSSDYKRYKDTHFTNDAVEIYTHHKDGKTPEEIVNLINSGKKDHLEKVNVDKVNLVLKIIDIAEKQIIANTVVDISAIARQIDNQISLQTVTEIIKRLNLGEPKYKHKFTDEQDAFVLLNYLKKIGPSESSRLFNLKFKTDTRGNSLNIRNGGIVRRLKWLINSGKGETGISQKILDLLKKYKNEYFATVNINDPETKERLTNYIPPEKISGKARLARKGGKVDPTRNMSGQGNLGPDKPQIFTTGELPVSGQLGKRYGAPINPQGASPL